MSGSRTAEPDAEAVAAAVRGVPEVLEVTAGFPAVATFLPGQRVDGVRITPSDIEVHVVAAYGVVLPDVANDVRVRLRPLAGDRTISVFIDDVRRPEQAAELPVAETR